MENDRRPPEQSIEQLKELNRGYIRSIQQSDVHWFEQHLAPDFVNTNPDGSRLNRAAFLAQVARPAGIKALEANDVLVRLFGDTGIIHARTAYRKPDGQSGAGWYTDVWMRLDSRWQCVSAHVDRE